MSAFPCSRLAESADGRNAFAPFPVFGDPLRKMDGFILRLLMTLFIGAFISSVGRSATLTATATNIVSPVNLSVEGTLDWAHWGLEATNLFNRKSTIVPRLSDASFFGAAPVLFVTNSTVEFAWTNGTGVVVTNTMSQLAVGGPDSAFEITVAADATVKRLGLHFGLVATEASIQASLSDGSASPFTTNVTTSTATNLLYVFNYSAGTTGQLLRVRVTSVAQFETNAALLVGAATLARIGSNQPPVVSLVSPTNETNLLPGNLTLSATASDRDGGVARVEFFAGVTKLGEATKAPYSLVWSNVPVGIHTLTAQARDDEGTNATSPAVTIFVITNGGSVSYSVSAPTGAVNLTLEGPADWIHWGLVTESSINRKAGVVPMIGTYSVVGTGPAYQFFDNFNGYTWTDGTPRAGVTNTTTGVYVFGVGNGFEIQAQATNAFRTLRVHVGAYAGRGRLRTFLSDYSAPVLNDVFVNNTANGPGAIYTINYRAATPGQRLIVRYTLASRYASDGNVTLQAASLMSDNNPPAVTLLSPTNGTAVRVGTNVVLLADATDGDGTISRVEFLRDATVVAVISNAPFTTTLTNVAAGSYTITARAVDDRETAAVSAPSLLHVVTGTGFVRGSMTNPPAAVNLTSEGIFDWVHWGLANKNSVNRLAGIMPFISDLVLIGGGNTQRYTDNFSAFSWINGTPTLAALATRTGIFVPGISNGFQITIPADTQPKRLNIYAGLYGARGRFEASLSDHSDVPYINNVLSRTFANGYAVYSVDFAAGSTNQALTVRYFAETLHDIDFGNVTWQAATLMPLLPTIQPPQLESNVFSGQFFASAGVSYGVEFSETLAPLSWQPLTNIPGFGSNAVFWDTLSATNRFYRVKLN